MISKGFSTIMHLVDGLLIIRNGQTVAEAYYNGDTADIPHNIMSVSKSMLSGVLTKATGQSTDIFARRYLFAPMGIDIDYWEKDPQGICLGGNSIHVIPREMAVLGLIVVSTAKNDVPRKRRIYRNGPYLTW